MPILCCLVCLATSPLLADATYLWTGSDPRFTGSFSISDSDYAAGSFSSLTAVDFQFHDPLNPGHDLVSGLNDVAPTDIYGILTADRQHLQHIPSPAHSGAGFWIASWQFEPAGLVGLYSLHDGLIPEERFQYYRINEGVFIDSIGTWSLQSVPEPSFAGLAGLGGLIGIVRARRAIDKYRAQAAPRSS